MRVVETLAKKKASWQLARLHHPNGLVTFHTGDDLSKPFTTWNRQTGQREWRLRDTHDGARLEFGPNVIVEAALRPENGLFTDRDGGSYWARPNEVFDILSAVASGAVRLEGGWILGRFTFINKSGDISLALAPRAPEPAAVPADAPDLSDFIRTLAP